MKEPTWILLAEDDPNDADLAIRALAAAQPPSEIVRAADGAEAMDCLYRRGRFRTRPADPPAVVLLDLKMPKVDGIEALRQMKSDARLKSIPVVMFTSSREEADVIRSYALGANAYVVKPVDYKEFVAALREVSVFWTLFNEPPPYRPGKSVAHLPSRPGVA